MNQLVKQMEQMRSQAEKNCVSMDEINLNRKAPSNKEPVIYQVTLEEAFEKTGGFGKF